MCCPYFIRIESILISFSLSNFQDVIDQVTHTNAHCTVNPNFMFIWGLPKCGIKCEKNCSYGHLAKTVQMVCKIAKKKKSKIQEHNIRVSVYIVIFQHFFVLFVCGT
jgi:hypothetical protein